MSLSSGLPSFLEELTLALRVGGPIRLVDETLLVEKHLLVLVLFYAHHVLRRVKGLVRAFGACVAVCIVVGRPLTVGVCHVWRW